jgi:hypothetical protein
MLADAGHIGYAEQPERFDTAVLSFLGNGSEIVIRIPRFRLRRASAGG